MNRESILGTRPATNAPRTRSTASIFIPTLLLTILFVLLFQYRILSLLKKLGMDVTPIGTKFPITIDVAHAPVWLLPLYYTLDYLNTIWFTTILGLLISGVVVTFLPHLIQSHFRGNGFIQHLAGLILGLPNMFCSCCAVSLLAGMRRAGSGLGTSLACFVTAPALNIVVLILAFEILPLRLALARLILGLIAAIGITYAVTMLSPQSLKGSTLSCKSDTSQAVTEALRQWLVHTWELARIVVPVLLVGFIIIGVLKAVFPPESVAQRFGNSPSSTILAALLGTVLMVPTFTEVLWVQEFMKHGIGTGPAVALLATLPTISFPSLWILARVLDSWKTAVLLGFLVFALGTIGGIVLPIF